MNQTQDNIPQEPETAMPAGNGGGLRVRARVRARIQRRIRRRLVRR